MICDTAIIKDSDIGLNTKIWEYTNIYGAKIGSNCTIGSFVEIQSGVIIGNNVTISSHSFICSMVEIMDDVFIGHGVMTINDLNPPSFKRTGSKENWKSTVIKNNAMVGSNATLFPVSVGEYSQIGAGSVVTKDVPDNAIIIGNPGKEMKK